MNDSPRPAAIGCPGSTTQSRSRSPSSRHFRSHGRAHQPPEDLREVAGVQDDQAHPVEDARVDAIDDRVVDLGVGDVAPPDEDVGLGEDRVGQACSGSSRVAVRTSRPRRRAGRRRWRHGCRPDRSPRRLVGRSWRYSFQTVTRMRHRRRPRRRRPGSTRPPRRGPPRRGSRPTGGPSAGRPRAGSGSARGPRER